MDGGYWYDDSVTKLNAFKSKEPGAARQALNLDRGKLVGPPTKGEHQMLNYLEIVPSKPNSRLYFITRSRLPPPLKEELCWRIEQLPARHSSAYDRGLVWGACKVLSHRALRETLDMLVLWSMQLDVDWELQFRRSTAYLGPMTLVDTLVREFEENEELPREDPTQIVPEAAALDIDPFPLKFAYEVDSSLQRIYSVGMEPDFAGWIVDSRNLKVASSYEQGQALEELLRAWNQAGPRIEISAEEALESLTVNIGNYYLSSKTLISADLDEARQCARQFIGGFGDRPQFWKIGKVFAGAGFDHTETIGAEGGESVGFVMTPHSSG